VLVILGIWAVRARRAATVGEDRTGFALTGVAACLISPVTWVHHLVWLIPALALLAEHGLRPLRRPVLAASAVLYVILCSSLVFLWRFDSTGADAFIGSNAYVWISLGLLIALPAAGAPAPKEPGPGPAISAGRAARA
jgi:alpha-1,2-mannosyltransferase